MADLTEGAGTPTDADLAEIMEQAALRAPAATEPGEGVPS